MVSTSISSSHSPDWKFNQAVTYVCSVAYMYALIVILGGVSLPNVTVRYWRKVPDPFLGPKGVRPLLLLRGYTGYDTTCALGNVSSHCHRRFTALSGMYFSLLYLSLSDAVVLKFLAPILTGFSGVIFLEESLSLKEVIAGREHL